MPTLLTHGAIGMAGAMLAGGRSLPRNGWRAFILLAIVPDIDVLAFRLSIPYGAAWGHRGMIHSLVFAACGSVLAFRLLRATRKSWECRPWPIWPLLFLVAASHPLLDALTNGGLGIALLAPCDNTRYFFPITPIEVSPIGLRGFVSARGVQVLANEILWVWLPMVVLLLIHRICAGNPGRMAPAERPIQREASTRFDGRLPCDRPTANVGQTDEDVG